MRSADTVALGPTTVYFCVNSRRMVLPLPSQPGVGHRDSASLLSVRPEGVDIVECGGCDVADDRKILRQGPRLNIDIFIVYRECWQFFGQQF